MMFIFLTNLHALVFFVVLWVLIIPMYMYFLFKSLINFICLLTVHGVEYAFGAHDYPTSGVFEVEPRQCPGFKFRKSIYIGTTCMDSDQVREFMEHHAASYNGDTYHLIAKNCNHFCKDICYKLTGKHIPKWVNRLAKIGISSDHVTPHVLYSSSFCHICLTKLAAALYQKHKFTFFLR
ncbi:hypothetical protein AgCh_037777 [Apium graveolens]